MILKWKLKKPWNKGYPNESMANLSRASQVVFWTITRILSASFHWKMFIVTLPNWNDKSFGIVLPFKEEWEFTEINLIANCLTAFSE